MKVYLNDNSLEITWAKEESKEDEEMIKDIRSLVAYRMLLGSVEDFEDRFKDKF